MKAIVNGIILLPDGEVRGKALLYEKTIRGIVTEEEARACAAEIIDAGGAYVSPGLIDIHIHGCQGADASDADPEGIRKIANGLLKNGVTGFLPTTMTVDWAILETVFDQMRTLKKESELPSFPGAQILGCHMEGPFINPSKKGAQAESAILAPDAQRVLPYADIIRTLTFAPEMPGGLDFIRTLREKTDIALSIGHTGATFEQAMAAIHLGVTRATHLFNAMTPLHHRDPGVAGAALASNIYCELIPDTFHVHAGLFPLLYRAKREKLVLITDSLRGAGMPDGEYTLGGQTFILHGIQCRLEDGTIAGSVLAMNQGVRNLRDHAALPMHLAVRSASLSPAQAVGLDMQKGSLEVGKDADITLLDPQCGVLRTIVGGECKYTAA